MQDLHWRYNFHTDQFDFVENNINQTYQPLLQNVTVPTLVIDINLVDSNNLSQYYYRVLDKCIENNIVYSQIIFEHTQDPVLDYLEKCKILENLSKTSGIKSYFAHVRFNAVQHQHLSEIVYPNQIILHRRRGKPPLIANRTHGFSCLNRNPSMHRLLFYTLIKQANLLDKFIFTFYDRCPYNGFKYGPNQYRQLRSFIDEKLYNQC